ncbi:hypothetical protein BCR44DRAFT_1434827 [Catenaria anguillulae PL171]|uniref:Uncharacterized protein n=2 Tax=Catenaria anguillulae PL171 TaxID=765915 RepID=A0A1Y2H917_9FUNG|nr:hypothetical protein BCR44DRAFT_1447084 [Catenaria anguillulae PL171]ORZ30933.1 hypothetical protein BCR44DRAFT_1443508 [Catenaria anguillulae PL171]ORZ31077.1 hypothetical protein BCR44DRAFT_1443155 [Catenaria anguillulae PL171]ORZ31262.1 hypothetical protein BCR44DRAFT_1442881 [Catenaria anguillulae PL171]ORZ33275.1 hypothetical protein BCR44DRAFT_1438655 [Catenaria anguillulae PL171]
MEVEQILADTWTTKPTSIRILPQPSCHPFMPATDKQAHHLLLRRPCKLSCTTNVFL